MSLETITWCGHSQPRSVMMQRSRRLIGNDLLELVVCAISSTHSIKELATNSYSYQLGH